MNYKKIIKDFFSTLAPLTANEEIIRNVTERAEKMEKKKRISIKKPVIAVCAAVAAVAVGTISVGAATDWDYFGVFGQIFGKSGENIKDNVVPEATVLCDTIDTMDFEIVAAAADKHSVMIIIDVYPENGFKLVEETEHGTIIHPIWDLFITIDSENIDSENISGLVVNPLEVSEEKVRLNVRMNTLTEIKNEKVTVKAAQKFEPVYENGFTTESYGGDYNWSAEFMVSYTGEEIRYEKELTVPCTVGSATVTGIEISPISAYVEGERLDNLFGEYGSYDENYVLFDNGERVIICEIATSGYEYPIGKTYLALTFAEPINPEEAVSVVIGGTVIELK